jgi:hypothetical protein
MIQVKHKTIINASVDKVREWFKEEMSGNYLTIHPKDHLELTRLDNGSLKVGSKFRLREKIGGRFYLSTIINITELAGNSFAFGCSFPYSLINVRARFSFRKIGKNKTEMVAENYGGNRLPIIGWLLDQIIYLFLPLYILKQHMKVENNGIKQEIEKLLT